MRLPAAALISSFIAAALLAGLGSTPASASPSPRYVSLGSSYAAGPGVGRRDASSGACARSLDNYARQIAARRGLELVDVACSGATTANIVSTPQFGFPPQIEAVDAATRLVTVTIGGNDVGYVANLTGLACRATSGADCRVVADSDVEAGFAALPGALGAMLAEVRRRAPKAAIVLGGYLPVLPQAGQGGCPPADPLASGEADRMRAVAARLDAVMQRVAAEAHVLFIRSDETGRGHDVCASAPWMAGYAPAQNPGWSRPVPFHPNQAGMDALAQAIGAALDRTGVDAGD